MIVERLPITLIRMQADRFVKPDDYSIAAIPKQIDHPYPGKATETSGSGCALKGAFPFAPAEGRGRSDHR